LTDLQGNIRNSNLVGLEQNATTRLLFDVIKALMIISSRLPLSPAIIRREMTLCNNTLFTLNCRTSGSREIMLFIGKPMGRSMMISIG